MFDRPQLGRILLSHGVVSDEQLEQALAHQRETGARLGETLITMGLCSELEISRALAEQLELPFIDLDQTPPLPRTLRLLPREVAVEYQVIPVRTESDRLLVAAHNPLDIRIDAAIRRATGMQVAVASGCHGQIRRFLDRYEQLKWIGHHRPGDAATAVATSHLNADPRLLASAEHSHTVQMVDSYIAHAVRRRASEICFENRGDGLHVRGRIDGHMYPMAVVPRQRSESILARLKIMTGIPLDDAGRVTGICRVRVDGAEVALESRVVPGADGESVILRTPVGAVRPMPIADLGLEPEHVHLLERILAARRGMVIVSGPVDSGRRTTLYSILSELARDDLKIISVEGEIRHRIPHVSYLSVAERASFASTVQLAVAQEPDVLMLSDVPDRRTAELACEAAAAGRLMLCGARASTAPGALARFLDVGIPPHQVAAALSGIVAQRLLRRICSNCSVPYLLPFEVERTLRARFGTLSEATFERGRGCTKCHQMGLRGRVGVFEVLEADDDLRYLLSDRLPPSVIHKHLRERGFRTLEEHAFTKACRKEITPEEIGQLRFEGTAGLASLQQRPGPAEDLEALAEMDASAWELKPEAEVNSWDEIASLVDTLG